MSFNLYNYLKIKVSPFNMTTIYCPLNLPKFLRQKQNIEHNFAIIITFCVPHLLLQFTMRPIFSSHVFAILSSLGLNGDSSLVLEIEDTPCNCYKVDMGASPHEIPIGPCAYEIPPISSNKFKKLHAKNALYLYSPHSKH
jgi:hypothetical protein